MQRGVVQNTSELQQDSPIGDFNWATNFPGGEGDRSHSGHQACRWPLRDIASHVRILKTFTHSNIVPFWKTFVTKKWVPFLRRGCIVPFQIPPLWTKKSKWAILNKKQYYTIIQYYIFAYPSPNPCVPQNIVWLIWPNRIFPKTFLSHEKQGSQ